MDKDLARHVARIGFSCMSHLTDLLPLLKTHCDAAEYDAYRKAIATVAGHISVDIINKALTPYPDLEKEIESKVEKYGVVI